MHSSQDESTCQTDFEEIDELVFAHVVGHIVH